MHFLLPILNLSNSIHVGQETRVECKQQLRVVDSVQVHYDRSNLSHVQHLQVILFLMFIWLEVCSLCNLLLVAEWPITTRKKNSLLIFIIEVEHVLYFSQRHLPLHLSRWLQFVMFVGDTEVHQFNQFEAHKIVSLFQIIPQSLKQGQPRQVLPKHNMLPYDAMFRCCIYLVRLLYLFWSPPLPQNRRAKCLICFALACSFHCQVHTQTTLSCTEEQSEKQGGQGKKCAFADLC